MLRAHNHGGSASVASPSNGSRVEVHRPVPPRKDAVQPGRTRSLPEFIPAMPLRCLEAAIRAWQGSDTKVGPHVSAVRIPWS